MTEPGRHQPRAGGPRLVAIVPHTHWDREWYSPFQMFRLRLVELLDDFLPLLESDLGYARFLLDGQMAVVDDYLEVRPEAESRLQRLASGGRVAMGPWPPRARRGDPAPGGSSRRRAAASRAGSRPAGPASP